MLLIARECTVHSVNQKKTTSRRTMNREFHRENYGLLLNFKATIERVDEKYILLHITVTKALVYTI